MSSGREEGDDRAAPGAAAGCSPTSGPAAWCAARRPRRSTRRSTGWSGSLVERAPRDVQSAGGVGRSGPGTRGGAGHRCDCCRRRWGSRPDPPPGGARGAWSGPPPRSYPRRAARSCMRSSAARRRCATITGERVRACRWQGLPRPRAPARGRARRGRPTRCCPRPHRAAGGTAASCAPSARWRWCRSAGAPAWWAGVEPLRGEQASGGRARHAQHRGRRAGRLGSRLVTARAGIRAPALERRLAARGLTPGTSRSRSSTSRWGAVRRPGRPGRRQAGMGDSRRWCSGCG